MLKDHQGSSLTCPFHHWNFGKRKNIRRNFQTFICPFALLHTHKQQSTQKKWQNQQTMKTTQSQNKKNLQNKSKSFSKNCLSSMSLFLFSIIILLDAKKSIMFLGLKAHPTQASTSQFFCNEYHVIQNFNLQLRLLQICNKTNHIENAFNITL